MKRDLNNEVELQHDNNPLQRQDRVSNQRWHHVSERENSTPEQSNRLDRYVQETEQSHGLRFFADALGIGGRDGEVGQSQQTNQNSHQFNAHVNLVDQIHHHVLINPQVTTQNRFQLWARENREFDSSAFDLPKFGS